MDTIGKFRTNFLGKGRSFKIGFNNRSPFSYISSTGPSVPASYDGGVPLVNFSPDDYAKAFDTSKAVRAEHEMFKKAGEAAGIVGGAVIGGIAGGIGGVKDAKATGNKATFKDFFQGAKRGFDEVKRGDSLRVSDEFKKGVDDGMSDITGRTGGSDDEDFYKKWFALKRDQYGG